MTRAARRLALVPEKSGGVFTHVVSGLASFLRARESAAEEGHADAGDRDAAVGVEAALAQAAAAMARGRLAEAAAALEGACGARRRRRRARGGWRTRASGRGWRWRSRCSGRTRRRRPRRWRSELFFRWTKRRIEPDVMIRTTRSLRAFCVVYLTSSYVFFLLDAWCVSTARFRARRVGASGRASTALGGVRRPRIPRASNATPRPRTSRVSSRDRMLARFASVFLLAPPRRRARADHALAAPRRALLVTNDAVVAVDPVGVFLSTVVSTSINLNFFCEFIKPMLDFELPPTYC